MFTVGQTGFVQAWAFGHVERQHPGNKERTWESDWAWELWSWAAPGQTLALPVAAGWPWASHFGSSCQAPLACEAGIMTLCAIDCVQNSTGHQISYPDLYRKSLPTFILQDRPRGFLTLICYFFVLKPWTDTLWPLLFLRRFLEEQIYEKWYLEDPINFFECRMLNFCLTIPARLLCYCYGYRCEY